MVSHHRDHTDLECICLELTGPLLTQLWPEGNYSHLRRSCSPRVQALVAHLFAAMAEKQPGWFAHKAAHFAGLASKELAAAENA